MNLEKLNKIFAARELPPVTVITKIDVGFTNLVYSLDNRLILKICEDEKNEKEFKNEVLFYDFFKNKLPVPKLLFYDDSQAEYPKHFMVYEKIQGENLYDVWHLLSTEERRKVVKQLCELLKQINATNLKKLPKGIRLRPVKTWKKSIETKIYHYLAIAERMQSLKPEERRKIEEFTETHSAALEEEKIAVTYWDVHFDNILIHNGEIVGLLDFERTELASIDFVLDTVKLMMEQPKKYMSKKAECFANAENYKDLMKWYEEFYPELFQFKNMKTRLAFYSIAHDLEDLENWPRLEALKKHLLSQL